jgi:signal transduction histidine kinase
LRVRVLVLCWLVALVPLVTLATLDARAARKALTEASYRSLVASAGQTAGRVDQFLTTNLEIIATESALPVLADYLVATEAAREDPPSRARVVSTLASLAVKDRIFISSSALLDLRGRDVIDTASSGIARDESGSPYFREALETDLPCASLAPSPGDDAKPALYFSSPVRDDRGRAVGVLRTRYDPAVLQQLVVTDSDETGTLAFPLLVDDDQVLLAHGAASELRLADFLFKKPAPLAPDRAEALRAIRRLASRTLGAPEAAGAEEARAELSEARIRLEAQVAFREKGRWAVAVRRLSRMPWSVVFVQPERVVLTPLTEITRNTVRLSLICAALIALIALGVARHLARPIEHLTQAARKIARGERGIPLRIRGGGSEIGLLAESFDHMMTHVQQREATLRERDEERSRMVEQLRDAVRGRDEFLAIASHELRTPLTPLKAQVQSLQLYLQRGDLSALPPARLDEALASVDRQVNRLDALIGNLLDVARFTRRQPELHLESVNLSELVTEVLARFRPQIVAARSPFELSLGEGLVGRWDRTRIEQVFTNLLTNALKYAGGTRIRVVTEARDGAARLIVEDHGVGIALEHQERIFQPFERAVSYVNVSGLGLGLYIVRQIVEAHRGHIHLESAPDHGATFTVDLPLHAAEGLDESANPARRT